MNSFSDAPAERPYKYIGLGGCIWVVRREAVVKWDLNTKTQRHRDFSLLTCNTFPLCLRVSVFDILRYGTASSAMPESCYERIRDSDTRYVRMCHPDKLSFWEGRRSRPTTTSVPSDVSSEGIECEDFQSEISKSNAANVLNTICRDARSEHPEDGIQYLDADDAD